MAKGYFIHTLKAKFLYFSDIREPISMSLRAKEIEIVRATFNLHIFSYHFFTEGRTLELHSPDAVHSCVLRATDASEAAAWFNTLHSALAVLTTAALHEASRAIPDLRHIGWLLRRPRSEVKKFKNHK